MATVVVLEWGLEPQKTNRGSDFKGQKNKNGGLDQYGTGHSEATWHH